MVNEHDLLPQPAFGEQLKRLRQERGLKQADLADDRGLSASYVSRIESGARAATPHVAQLLAQRLGVDLTAFTGNREAELARLLADGQTCLFSGDAAGAVRAFTEALACAHRPPLSLVWTLRHALITALSSLGRLAEWREQQEALLQLAVDADAPYLIAQAKQGMSNCLRLAGEVAPAYLAARDAYDLTNQHGLAADLRAQCLMALIAAEVEIGRGAEATRHAEQLLDQLEDTSGPTRAQAQWAVATTLSSRGRHAEAVDLITRAMAELASGEDIITWARLRLAAVSIRQRAGEPVPEDWRASYREAALVLRRAAIPVLEAQLDLSEARLAAEEGRIEEALAHCEAALARGDLLFFRDRARAGMLAARLRTTLGDRERALVDLRLVAEELQEAGAMDLAAEAWQTVADMALAGRD